MFSWITSRFSSIVFNKETMICTDNLPIRVNPDNHIYASVIKIQHCDWYLKNSLKRGGI